MILDTNALSAFADADEALLAVYGRVVNTLYRFAIVPRLGPEDIGNEGLGIAVIERKPA